jgi:hypothetical protein
MRLNLPVSVRKILLVCRNWGNGRGYPRADRKYFRSSCIARQAASLPCGFPAAVPVSPDGSVRRSWLEENYFVERFVLP